MPMSVVDLFAPAVPEERWHVAYRRLLESDTHASTRLLLNQIAQRMGDADGNLVTEFQGQAFHARLFELACFAYLEEQGLAIDRSQSRPDFIVQRGGVRFGIESVTANAADDIGGQRRDVSVLNVELLEANEVAAKCNDEFPIRMGGALRSKLSKEYWKLPQCAGRPFVLAVAAFHEPAPTAYIDLSLGRFLYGLEGAEIADGIMGQIPVKNHSYRGKSIPSNFFEYENAEYVSAVLFCNQFTVPRFYRMAAQVMGEPPGTYAYRSGECFTPELPNHDQSYGYFLRDDDAPFETWAQGVSIFRNPRALWPLPEDALGCTCTFDVSGVLMVRKIHGFHPMTSRMFVGVSESSPAQQTGR